MRKILDFKTSKKINLRIVRIFTYAMLGLFSFISLIPLGWLLSSSLKPDWQVFTFPPQWIPNPVKWENYILAFQMVPFVRYFLNTSLIVVAVLGGVLITGSLSAFSFARLRWVGRDVVFGIILSSLMMPFAVLVIPTFIIWKYLGGIDTYAPLTVPAWFGGGAFNIFLLRQFFMTIPLELDDAARIDGASSLRILFTIIIPLAKPALAVISIFTFIGTWNQFLMPVIYLNSPEKFTVALGLAQFVSTYTARWHLMMAATTVVIIPVVVIFFALQKYFIQGIALTGLKG